jgi:hypothetical protein
MNLSPTGGGEKAEQMPGLLETYSFTIRSGRLLKIFAASFTFSMTLYIPTKEGNARKIPPMNQPITEEGSLGMC